MSEVATKKIAVVTGANRGIGFEVARQLAKKDYFVVLTARNAAATHQAAEKMKSEGLDVTFKQLDVTSEESIFDFVTSMKREYGKIDVLVNNAGVLFDPPRHPPDQEGASILNAKIDTIRKSLETNTFGALRLCQLIVPMMLKRDYGRIVNVSSGMGQISDMNGGWPGYRLSKLALNGVTKIFADELQGTNVLINSVCPGWVRTDMGGKDAELSTEEGADTIVWAAMLPDGGQSGKFLRERQEVAW